MLLRPSYVRALCYLEPLPRDYFERHRANFWQRQSGSVVPLTRNFSTLAEPFESLSIDRNFRTNPPSCVRLVEYVWANRAADSSDLADAMLMLPRRGFLRIAAMPSAAMWAGRLIAHINVWW